MTIRITISGIGVSEIERLIKEVAGEKVRTTSMSDYEAAIAIKSGQADYFIGSCNTGGGGALGLAIAILGAHKCAIISFPGIPPKADKVKKFFNEGRIAFGITQDHIKSAIPLIVKAILEKHDL